MIKMTRIIRKEHQRSIARFSFPTLIACVTPFFNVLVKIFSNPHRRPNMFRYYVVGIMAQTFICFLSLKLLKRFSIIYIPILMTQLFLAFESRVIENKYRVV